MGALGQAKLVAFLGTRDRARAKAFFAGTLGLPLVHEDNFAMVFDAGGTALRVTPVRELTPQPFTVVGWRVDDVPAAVQALSDAGVEFARFDGLVQDGLGIWSPGGDVKVAWFKDPDGNLLSISNG